MTINKDGLLSRWYGEWEARGGKRPPQMNLCHFMRVCLVWTPWRIFWCFRRKEARKGRWSPTDWSIFLWLFLVSLVVGVVWYTIAFPVNVLRALGFVSGMFLLIYTGVKMDAWEKRRGIRHREPEELWEAFHVWRDYRAARHNKICPLVEIK